ncbi:MAG: hypothetical protein GY861_02695 [bacterium]|nr:hypothetical protein [bacterium]
MKETLIKCNMCEEYKDDCGCEMHGFYYDENSVLCLENVDSAEMHICDVCLKAIKRIKTT